MMEFPLVMTGVPPRTGVPLTRSGLPPPPHKGPGTSHWGPKGHGPVEVLWDGDGEKTPPGVDLQTN